MINNIEKTVTLSFIGGGLGSSIGKIHFLASQFDSNFKVIPFFLAEILKKILILQKIIISRMIEIIQI